jgi:hypothetical protein
MADAPKAGGGEVGKGGQPPLVLKKGGNMADEPDAAAAPKKVAKPLPSSGRSVGRAIIIAAVLMTIAWVYDSATQPRYALAPSQTSENTFMYRLDQRTGDVHFCTTQQCVELPVKGQP